MSKERGRSVILPKRSRAQVTSVLGLDVSSTTIGWGLVSLTSNGLLLGGHGHIKPLASNKYSLLERLDDVYERIANLCKQLHPTHVAVEDIFVFMKGQSTARTITVLTSFNRAAALSAYRHANKNVNFYSVHEIRKTIKQECLNSKEKISKEDMPDLIKNHLYGDFSFVINKKGNQAKETFDESDGIAVAWANCIKLRDGQ